MGLPVISGKNSQHFKPPLPGDFDPDAPDEAVAAMQAVCDRVSYRPMGGPRVWIGAGRDADGRLWIGTDTGDRINSHDGTPKETYVVWWYPNDPFDPVSVLDCIAFEVAKGAVHTALEWLKWDDVEIIHDPHQHGNPAIVMPECETCDIKRYTRLRELTSRPKPEPAPLSAEEQADMERGAAVGANEARKQSQMLNDVGLLSIAELQLVRGYREYLKTGVMPQPLSPPVDPAPIADEEAVVPDEAAEIPSRA